MSPPYILSNFSIRPGKRDVNREERAKSEFNISETKNTPKKQKSLRIVKMRREKFICFT